MRLGYFCDLYLLDAFEEIMISRLEKSPLSKQRVYRLSLMRRIFL